MTNTEYPLIYQDSLGKEFITCLSDGHSLQMTIRNVTFNGSSFNMLEPYSEEDISEQFIYDSNGYLSAVFTIQIPLTIKTDNITNAGKLHLCFDYRQGNDISYSFEYEEIKITTERKFGFIEDVLIDLKKHLAITSHLKCCLSCAFSSYHPVGNNDFGGLGCFRLNKKEIIKVKDKSSLMDVWDESYKEKRLFFVQETFLCDQFSIISSGQSLYKSY